MMFVVLLLNLKTKKILRRDWKNFNQDNFVIDFLEIDWANKLYSITDVDQAFKTFNELIQNLTDQHVPYCDKTPTKTQAKPWITPGIIKSISQRQFYSRKYIQTKDPLMKSFYYQRYNTHKNRI